MADNISILFKDKNLLTQALTHRSWVNENKGQRRSNERLEFLGDAVLGLIVSREIYKKFPEKEEGYLSELRSKLVNTQHLSEVATKLNISEKIYFSKGILKNGGKDRKSILADTMESIIGALYLDQGMEGATNFVIDHILSDLVEITKKPLKDAKSKLQEIVQTKGMKPPIYKVVRSYGPAHAKLFVVEVLIDGKTSGKGSGGSKLEASQNAAIDSLSRGSMI